MTPGSTRLIEAALWRWVNFARRKRDLVMGFWLIALVVAGFFALGLRVNTDTQGMIHASAPFQRQLDELEAAFPGIEDQVLVIVRGDLPGETERFAAALLHRLSVRNDIVRSAFAPEIDPFFQAEALLYLEADELAESLPGLVRAVGMLEQLDSDPDLARLFARLAGLTADDAAIDPEQLAAFQDELAAVITARLDGNPRRFSWRSLFPGEDNDGPSQLILTLDPVLDFDTFQPARRVRDGILAEAHALREELGGSIEVMVTGDHVLRSDELMTVSNGIWLALGVSLTLVGLLLLAALRSVLMAMMTLIALVISIAITGGLAALFLGPLNLVSVAFAVLMVGLGVDFAIHLSLHAQAERRLGRSTRAALYRTVREIGAGLALTAPTTALAFFAFAPTAFTGMTQLGIIAGFGVLIAFTVTTSLLPAALTLLPGGEGKLHIRKAERLRSPGLGRMAALIVVVLALAATTLIPQARFDADPMNLRDPDTASVIAFNTLFDQTEHYPYRLSLLAPDAETGAQLAARFAQLPEVGSVITLLDFVPSDQDARVEQVERAAAALAALPQMPASPVPVDIPLAEAITSLRSALDTSVSDSAAALDRALAALESAPDNIRTGVEEDVFALLPYERSRLEALLTPTAFGIEDLPAPVLRRFLASDGRVRVEITPALDVRDAAVRREFVDAALAIRSDVTGTARTVMESADIVTASMRQAVLTALIAVSLLLWLTIRRFWLIVAMITPLILAGILTTATGVLVGMPYNYANVIVLPLLVGVGIDSGIHLALRATRTGRPEKVLNTTTPRAVFFSAVTTIASFGSLSLSAHRGTSSMGALLTIAIFWTLVCTILVLPYLMEIASRLGRKRHADNAAQ